jgi:hypothetical protein
LSHLRVDKVKGPGACDQLHRLLQFRQFGHQKRGARPLRWGLSRPHAWAGLNNVHDGTRPPVDLYPRRFRRRWHVRVINLVASA